MSIEVFSPELDYDTRVLNASTSIYRTIVPQASSTPTLSNNSTVGPVEFVIPASVWNPKKSRLNFTYSHAVATTGGKFSWCNANALTMINRIVLYDVSTNAVWLDCSQFNNYASCTSTAGTKLDEFLTKAGVGGTAGSAIPVSGFPAEDIEKSNSLNNYTVGMDGAAVDTGALNAYMGRRQRFIKDVQVTGVSYDFSIPFSAFNFTVLELDRQLYNPSNMILQIYFNGTDAFNFVSDTGTAVAAVTSVESPALSNLSVSLCNEGNLEVVGQVIETVMKSGISIPISYPTTTRQSIASSAQHSYQLQLTRGFGQRILAIISAPFSTAVGASKNIIGTANVHGRGEITFYNTFINNVALKFPNGYDCTKSADYFVGNKEQLVGSALQNLAEYVVDEWIHSDSFIGDKPLCHLDQTIISGLDVSNQSSTWQIQATLNNPVAYNWITIVIGQKIMTLSNSGSVVV